jgi:hypothetical protein
MSTEAATPPAPATEPVPAVEEVKPIASEAVPESTVAAPEAQKVDTDVPAASSSTPLAKLLSELPEIIKEAGHGEMWGVDLQDEVHVPTSIVLEKFLRANIHEKVKDVAKAKAQLTEALKWRKKMDPIKLMNETEFNAAKFGGLGYVTVYPQKEGKEIVTWNIYGAVQDKKATFGNVEE